MYSSKKRISFAGIEKFRLPIYHRKGKVKYVSFYVLQMSKKKENNKNIIVFFVNNKIIIVFAVSK